MNICLCRDEPGERRKPAGEQKLFLLQEVLLSRWELYPSAAATGTAGASAEARSPAGGNPVPALRHSCRSEPEGTQLLETLRWSCRQLVIPQERGLGWEKGL